MCDSYIIDLAGKIYEDIGEPSGMTPSYVQSKLVSNMFIGRLNILLSESHVIQTGNIYPELNTDEQAVYYEMYKADYYTKKSLEVLPTDANNIQWTSLKEGDTSISRTDVTKISSYYIKLAADSQAKINDLSSAYRFNRSLAQGISLPNVVLTRVIT